MWTRATGGRSVPRTDSTPGGELTNWRMEQLVRAGFDPELAAAVAADRAMSELSRHQREVLIAVAVNGVPIDVLAERLNTSRGALYKTIHDARKKLRANLADAGLRFVSEPEMAEPR
jgi:DNA-directed RNA polymerase specialized sigma24 family protein